MNTQLHLSESALTYSMANHIISNFVLFYSFSHLTMNKDVIKRLLLDW